LARAALRTAAAMSVRRVFEENGTRLGRLVAAAIFTGAGKIGGI